MLVQLVGQLHYFYILEAHLSQDLLDSVQLDHPWLLVLTGEKAEGILDVDLIVLVVALQVEYLKKVYKEAVNGLQRAPTIEAEQVLLLEHQLELGLLLLIRLEVDHLEDLAEPLIVDLLVDRVEHEDLAEVLLVHVLDSSRLLAGCLGLHFF